jgi:hypothetical protein
VILVLLLACGTPTSQEPPTGGIGDSSAPRDDTAPGDSGAVDSDDSGAGEPCDEQHPDWATWWTDADGDGYGDPATEQGACAAPASGVAQAGDCDDTDATVFPGAAEVCGDADDDDCDGLVDVAAEASAWYADSDGDGFGDPARTESACDPAAGWVADATDCAPDDGDRFPGALEACNDGIDDDCDGADMACGFSGEIDLADGTRLHATTTSYDAGRWVDVGDATGDGVGDVLVSTLLAENYGGGGYLVPGPIGGSATLDEAGHRLGGDHATTYGAGRSIGIADVDGDGVDDVAFGSPYQGTGPGTWILLGPIDGDRDVDSGEVHLVGPTNSYAGHGGDIADVSGDGVADAIVGAYSAARDAGVVFVQYGPLDGEYTLADVADAALVGETSGSYTGRHARAGEDVNGDGIGDIVTSAVYASGGALRSGIAYVVHGPPAGELDFADAAARLLGEANNDQAGSSVNAGDLDGDGYADVVVSAYGTRQEGKVYVVFGPVEGDVDLGDAEARIDGTAGSQMFGVGGGAGGALDAADTDGDGREDLLVGAYGTISGGRSAGAGYLFLGPVSGSLTAGDAEASFLGTTDSECVGIGAALGDLDADGHADVVLGAAAYSGVASSAGAVYVLPSGG